MRSRLTVFSCASFRSMKHCEKFVQPLGLVGVKNVDINNEETEQVITSSKHMS